MIRKSLFIKEYWFI